MDFILKPYESVGKINFGMTVKEVESILGKAEKVIERNGRKDMIWQNLSVKYDKDKKVNEIGFSQGKFKVFYDDIDLLNNPNAGKLLDEKDKSFEKLGFKVYFKPGLSITGFSDDEESTSVSFFSKDLVKRWEDLVKK